MNLINSIKQHLNSNQCSEDKMTQIFLHLWQHSDAGQRTLLDTVFTELLEEPLSHLIKDNHPQYYENVIRNQGIIREIHLTWCIEDVKEIRSDLTDEQCSHVLITAQNDYNCELGISWDTLWTICEELYPVK